MELFINKAKPRKGHTLAPTQLITVMSDEKESIHGDSLSVAKLTPLDVDDGLAVQLPESLANLSEEERDAVAKSGTRKVDIMLIPACKCWR